MHRDITNLEKMLDIELISDEHIIGFSSQFTIDSDAANCIKAFAQ